MIKVNKFFFFFSPQCFLKEIENTFSVFLSSYRNICGSLGALQKAVFPQHFSFSQTSTFVSITRQKHGTCFLVLKYRIKTKSKAPNENKLTWLEPVIQSKPILGQCSSVQKRKLPIIWSCDTGRWIPCFDRCQLTITWMSNVRQTLQTKLHDLVLAGVELPCMVFSFYACMWFCSLQSFGLCQLLADFSYWYSIFLMAFLLNNFYFSNFQLLPFCLLPFPYLVSQSIHCKHFNFI